MRLLFLVLLGLFASTASAGEYRVGDRVTVGYICLDGDDLSAVGDTAVKKGDVAGANVLWVLIQMGACKMGAFEATLLGAKEEYKAETPLRLWLSDAGYILLTVGKGPHSD